MPEEKTTTKPEDDERAKAVKQAKSDSLSPEQKHKNYLELLERLHNEEQ